MDTTTTTHQGQTANHGKAWVKKKKVPPPKRTLFYMANKKKMLPRLTPKQALSFLNSGKIQRKLQQKTAASSAMPLLLRATEEKLENAMKNVNDLEQKNKNLKKVKTRLENKISEGEKKGASPLEKIILNHTSLFKDTAFALEMIKLNAKYLEFVENQTEDMLWNVILSGTPDFKTAHAKIPLTREMVMYWAQHQRIHDIPEKFKQDPNFMLGVIKLCPSLIQFVRNNAVLKAVAYAAQLSGAGSGTAHARKERVEFVKNFIPPASFGDVSFAKQALQYLRVNNKDIRWQLIRTFWGNLGDSVKQNTDFVAALAHQLDPNNETFEFLTEFIKKKTDKDIIIDNMKRSSPKFNIFGHLQWETGDQYPDQWCWNTKSQGTKGDANQLHVYLKDSWEQVAIIGVRWQGEHWEYQYALILQDYDGDDMNNNDQLGIMQVQSEWKPEEAFCDGSDASCTFEEAKKKRAKPSSAVKN